MKEYPEFIINPSTLSKEILKIVKKSEESVHNNFSRLSFFGKVNFRIKYLTNYTNTFNFIRSFQFEKNDEIEEFFESFQKISYFIALNNFLLVYAYKVEKKHINPIITKEDQKILALQKLKKKTISRKEFNKLFGHYALNAYELSSKRFSEYSNKELLEIIKFTDNFKMTKTYSLKDYINKKGNKNLYAIYSTLREELKYIALKNIAQIRLVLLKYQKEKKVKKIFDLTYDEIKRKINC